MICFALEALDISSSLLLNKSEKRLEKAVYVSVKPPSIRTRSVEGWGEQPERTIRQITKAKKYFLLIIPAPFFKIFY